MTQHCLKRVVAVGYVATACVAAHAFPTLQIYLEGGTYNEGTQSWELIDPPGFSAGDPFRLWVIGNVAGPGGGGPILDVRLSFAYDAVDGAPLIQLTPSTTNGFGGSVDPSTPTGTGTLLQTVTDGSSPILGDGRPLPPHEIYGPGVHWQEFALGDFTLSDSPLADFVSAFPTESTPASGQINTYEVLVPADSGLSFHVDVYDHVEGANHAVFAPFSHDGDVVPLPGTAVLALFGVVLAGWRRRR